jgi:hypothetical protein
VKRTPAEEIVDFLSFSGTPGHRLAGLRDFRQRDWKHAVRWLDDGGLAFYFLRKVKHTNAANTIPAWVVLVSNKVSGPTGNVSATCAIDSNL